MDRKQAALQALNENPGIGRYALARRVTELTGVHCSEKWARNFLAQARADGPLKDVEPDKLIQIEKAQLQAKHERQQLERTKRILAVGEIVGDKLAQAVAMLKPIEPPKVNAVKHDGEIEDIVVLISDCQLGQKIDEDEMGGLNAYDIYTFTQRLWLYLRRVKEIVAERRAAGKQVRRIHVWLLGDIIEGETIYNGQVHHIEQNVFDQSITASELLSRFITELLTLDAEVEVETIIGNHGRIGKKGDTALRVNFDNVVYEYIRLRTQHLPRLKFNGPHKSWWRLVSVLGWKFHLSHGDDVKSWAGIPFYGLARAFLNDYILLAQMKEQFTYWVAGDKHTQFNMDMGVGEIISNSNFVGTSLFSAKALSKGGRPNQTVFGVTELEGVTWRRPVYLDVDLEDAA